MSTNVGILQQYFSNYRRTPPRRALSAPFALWKKSNSTRSSLKSTTESFESRHRVEMEAPLNPLTTTNGTLNHDTPAEPSATASTFDASVFRSYLLALLPPVIGALPSDLESLFDDEFDERVARFAADNGAVVYVVKVKDESDGALLMFLCFRSVVDHRV